jgi:CRP-like cAMP-binding protein
VGFLDGLAPESAAAVEALGRVRRYPKGSLIFAEGDGGTEVLLIRSGAVKVLVTAPNGREVVLDVMERGEILGEMSAIDAGDRSATAMALTDVDVLAIAQSSFRARIEADPALALHVLQMLAIAGEHAVPREPWREPTPARVRVERCARPAVPPLPRARSTQQRLDHGHRPDVAARPRRLGRAVS